MTPHVHARTTALARTTAVAGLVLAAGVAAVASASSASAAPASSSWRHHDAGAVFVQNDALAGNAVVAYDRADDGSLQQAGVFPTGGLRGPLEGARVDRTAAPGAPPPHPGHRPPLALHARNGSGHG